jgi:hypothetical protein
MAQVCTAAQLERLCRMVRRAQILTWQGDRTDDRRTLRTETLESGMVRLTAVLHPDEAALVMKAIQHARRHSTASPRPDMPAAAAHVPAESAEMRRSMPPMVDSLITVAETYLAFQDAPAHGGPRPQIFVHLDHDPLTADGALAATLDDGTRVSAEALRRLSCDATLVPVHHDAAAPHPTLGRPTRTVSPTLRRALALRDRGCAFPACPNQIFLHAHHVRHWAHGGPTTLDNLVLLCTTHHRLVHEGGLGLRRDEAGNLRFTDPCGKPITTTPPAPELDRDGIDALSLRNRHAGLEIDAQTGHPGWDGERVDYMWAANAILRESLQSPE